MSEDQMNDIIAKAEAHRAQAEAHRAKGLTEVTATTQPQPDNTFSYSSIELPSKGKLGYPTYVEYRDIMVKDEKAVANATENTFFTTLNSVLKSLLKEPKYFDDMSVFDRDFLLMWIWSNNYDTQKKVNHVCTHCGESSEYQIDVTELDISELHEKYSDGYIHPFRSGKNLPIRLMTVRDERIAAEYAKKHNKSPVDDVYVMMIMSVDSGNNMSLIDKLKWADNTLTGKDMAEIRGFHAFFKFGIDDKLKRNCTHCGEGETISIPFQIDDFLPTIECDFSFTV